MAQNDKTNKTNQTDKTDQIDESDWETQFYQNESIRFGLWEFETHGNAKFEQVMISMEE